jgi:uncharacterized protein YjbJ (UPF0337 family)
MGKTATLALKITGDAASGKNAFDETEDKAPRTSARRWARWPGSPRARSPSTRWSTSARNAFDAASNLEQMQGSVEAVFGSATGQMLKFADSADQAVGLSQAAYEQLAAVMGSQLKNAGVPTDQLAGKVNGLIQKGADMSAVFGGSAADAVDALSSVLKGEFDPIEKYGVSLNQNAINAQAAADGAKKVAGQYSKQAQVAAALELVTKQTTATQGQFAAQSDTAAESSQKLSAWFENVQARIGGFLLPMFVALGTFLQTKLGPVFHFLFDEGQPFSNFLYDVADFVTGKVIPAVSGLFDELAPKLIPAFQQAGSFLQNVLVPAFENVFQIVMQYIIPTFKAILIPIIQGVIGVWHSLEEALERNKGKFEDILEKVKPMLAFLRDNVAPFIGTILKGAFEVLGKSIGVVVDAVAWILDKAATVVGFIGKVGSFLFGSGGGSGGGSSNRGAPMLGAARGAVFGAASSLGGGGAGPSVAAGGLTAVPVGDTYVITVQGALDPTAVADQIARLLDTRARRLGQRPAFGAAA